MIKKFVPRCLITTVGLILSVFYFVFMVSANIVIALLSKKNAETEVAPNFSLFILLTAATKLQIYFIGQVLVSRLFAGNVAAVETIGWQRFRRLSATDKLINQKKMVLKNQIVGICFVLNNMDVNQLSSNIVFFSSYCSKVVIIKNGDSKFSIDSKHFSSIQNVEIIEK